MMTTFAEQLIQWQHHNGRHHLPWQNTQNPYAIWVSEIMLQQTQVKTVIPYYERFMRHFPTIGDLAQATLDTVLTLWSGLGYYSRARHLHRAAQIIMQDYQGEFPLTQSSIQQLPGIGRSTAAAIAVFAFNQRAAILDGNVKRILTRYFAIEGYPNTSKTLHHLWQKAEELLPEAPGKIKCYTQALMDLGASICTYRKPNCTICPLQRNCFAWRNDCIALFPTKKKALPLPKKEAIFLILQQQHKILLQKRPIKGIWGGLWSFPELTIDTAINEFCQRMFPMIVHASISLPTLDHQFTHYKLRIYPRLLQVKPQVSSLSEEFCWLTPDEALDYAIPTPVKLLLQRTFTTTSKQRTDIEHA